MSIEQAKALAEKMKRDDKFRDRVTAIEDVEERLTMIKDEGFDCSAEELQQVQTEIEDIVQKGDIGCNYCAPAHL